LVESGFSGGAKGGEGIGSVLTVGGGEGGVISEAAQVTGEIAGVTAELEDGGGLGFADGRGYEDGRPGDEGGEEVPEDPNRKAGNGEEEDVARDGVEVVEGLVGAEDLDEEEEREQAADDPGCGDDDVPPCLEHLRSFRSVRSLRLRSSGCNACSALPLGRVISLTVAAR